jgi:hypothetical protein
LRREELSVRKPDAPLGVTFRRGAHNAPTTGEGECKDANETCDKHWDVDHLILGPKGWSVRITTTAGHVVVFRTPPPHAWETISGKGGRDESMRGAVCAQRERPYG